MTNSEMVKEFHKATNVPIGAFPDSHMPPERQTLRAALMREEFEETIDAMFKHDIAGIADGLADLLYVVYGTAVEYGIDIDEVFKEVHRSNMSKMDENGSPIFRHDGKVLKGPNYSPPDIKAVLDRQFLRD